MTHQGAGGATYSSWPSGAVAAPPVAPVAASARVAMIVSSFVTVAGALLVVVLFGIVIMSFKWILNAWDRRAALGSRSGRRRRGVGTVAAGGRTRRGVDPEVLRSLPVTVYCRAVKDDPAAAVECAVCLAELEDGEEARFLPRCGHGFHAECVDMWLASHCTCPLCRLAVVKPDAPPTPALALALPTVPPEPANRATNLPASVLLGLSDQGAVTAVTVANDDGTTPSSTGTTGVLVIEIPESIAPVTPRDAAKSPGSVRLRSMRRLWSFGRQGAGPSSSCSCGGAGEGADVEQGTSVATGIAVVETLPTTHASACATAAATQGASA